MIADAHPSSRRERSKSRHTRVWLNGIEVTNDCYFADDRRGIVRLYLRDSNGRIHLDERRMEVAKAEKRGRVRIARHGRVAA